MTDIRALTPPGGIPTAGRDRPRAARDSLEPEENHNRNIKSIYESLNRCDTRL